LRDRRLHAPVSKAAASLRAFLDGVAELNKIADRPGGSLSNAGRSR
jgi:hypothetical protein